MSHQLTFNLRIAGIALFVGLISLSRVAHAYIAPIPLINNVDEARLLQLASTSFWFSPKGKVCGISIKELKGPKAPYHRERKTEFDANGNLLFIKKIYATGKRGQVSRFVHRTPFAIDEYRSFDKEAEELTYTFEHKGLFIDVYYVAEPRRGKKLEKRLRVLDKSVYQVEYLNDLKQVTNKRVVTYDENNYLKKVVDYKNGKLLEESTMQWVAEKKQQSITATKFNGTVSYADYDAKQNPQSFIMAIRPTGAKQDVTSYQTINYHYCKVEG